MPKNVTKYLGYYYMKIGCKELSKLPNLVTLVRTPYLMLLQLHHQLTSAAH